MFEPMGPFFIDVTTPCLLHFNPFQSESVWGIHSYAVLSGAGTMTLVTPDAIKHHSPNSIPTIATPSPEATATKPFYKLSQLLISALCKKNRNLVKCECVVYMVHPLKRTGKPENVLNAISLELR